MKTFVGIILVPLVLALALLNITLAFIITAVGFVGGLVSDVLDGYVEYFSNKS